MSSPQTPDLLRKMDAQRGRAAVSPFAPRKVGRFSARHVLSRSERRHSPASEHPHGLTDKEFDTLFTKARTIICAFHGYPWLMHRLTYRRTNHKNLHVRGYKEEGTKTPCAT